jgi:hypothetical protein
MDGPYLVYAARLHKDFIHPREEQAACNALVKTKEREQRLQIREPWGNACHTILGVETRDLGHTAGNIRAMSPCPNRAFQALFVPAQKVNPGPGCRCGTDEKRRQRGRLRVLSNNSAQVRLLKVHKPETETLITPHGRHLRWWANLPEAVPDSMHVRAKPLANSNPFSLDCFRKIQAAEDIGYEVAIAHCAIPVRRFVCLICYRRKALGRGAGKTLGRPAAIDSAVASSASCR